MRRNAASSCSSARGVHRRDAGGVDQQARWPEPLRHRVRRCRAGGRIGHVGRHGDRVLTDLPGHALALSRRARDHGHPRALGGQGQRDGPSDAASSAGDEGDAPGEVTSVMGHAADATRRRTLTKMRTRDRPPPSPQGDDALPRSRASRRDVPLPPAGPERLRRHPMAARRPVDGKLVVATAEGQSLNAKGIVRYACARRSRRRGSPPQPRSCTTPGMPTPHTRDEQASLCTPLLACSATGT